MAQKQTIVLIGCVSDIVTRGEGVQNPENFADVINGSPLMVDPQPQPPGMESAEWTARKIMLLRHRFFVASTSERPS